MKKISLFFVALLVFSVLVSGCQSQAEKQQKQANDLANQAFGEDKKEKPLRNYGDHEAIKNQNKK